MFVSACVVPSVIGLFSNALIFFYVYAAWRRAQKGNAPQHVRGRTVSHRDLHLLRHMIVMFAIFSAGSAPLSITGIVKYHRPISPLIDSWKWIWYDGCLLISMLDLFLYNHEVSGYLIELSRRCWWQQHKRIPPIVAVS